MFLHFGFENDSEADGTLTARVRLSSLWAVAVLDWDILCALVVGQRKVWHIHADTTCDLQAQLSNCRQV